MDVVPGKLGDRWLVSTLGCLFLTKGFFYRVVPADQGFESAIDSTHSSGDFKIVFLFSIQTDIPAKKWFRAKQKYIAFNNWFQKENINNNKIKKNRLLRSVPVSSLVVWRMGRSGKNKQQTQSIHLKHLIVIIKYIQQLCCYYYYFFHWKDGGWPFANSQRSTGFRSLPQFRPILAVSFRESLRQVSI